jgi:hypothetical protein
MKNIKQLKNRYNYHAREARRFARIQEEMNKEGFERVYTYSENCPAQVKRIYHENACQKLHIAIYSLSE